MNFTDAYDMVNNNRELVIEKLHTQFKDVLTDSEMKAFVDELARQDNISLAEIYCKNSEVV